MYILTHLRAYRLTHSHICFMIYIYIYCWNLYFTTPIHLNIYIYIYSCTYIIYTFLIGVQISYQSRTGVIRWARFANAITYETVRNWFARFCARIGLELVLEIFSACGTTLQVMSPSDLHSDSGSDRHSHIC